MRHDCYSIPMPIWPKGAHIPQMKILIFLLSHFPLLIKSLSFWKHWQQKYKRQGVPLYWEGSFPGGPEESLWVPQSQVSILHWHKWDLNQVIDFHNCFVYWVPSDLWNSMILVFLEEVKWEIHNISNALTNYNYKKCLYTRTDSIRKPSKNLVKKIKTQFFCRDLYQDSIQILGY